MHYPCFTEMKFHGIRIAIVLWSVLFLRYRSWRAESGALHRLENDDRVSVARIGLMPVIKGTLSIFLRPRWHMES